MTNYTVPTKDVVHTESGTKMTINVKDFDPRIHTDPSAKVEERKTLKAPPVEEKKVE